MEPISTTAALIGAGSSLLGGGAQAFAQGRMNKATRKWNEKMYATQKQDSLDFWNMQNSYNSPQEQMARLQKAGLNPQLVYGQGAVANASSAPDTPHAMPFRAEAPNLGSSIQNVPESYFNIQTQQQLLSNQKQQGNILALEAAGKLEDNRSKSMLNNFMETRGYDLKRDSGEAALQRILLANIGTEALQNFNFGGTANLSGMKDGSAWSLQAKGAKLLNELRSGEKRMQGLRNVEQSIRNKYLKRTMSGELGDMSAKDWIQSIIGAGSVINR